jgi:hypothetical protein
MSASQSVTAGFVSNLPATGWTDFPPSADSRIIYVSSSAGNDANDGLSQATPKRTLTNGYEALRSGYPDHLRIMRGDTLSEDAIFMTKSGRSVTEPLVIEAYGNEALPRPVWRTGYGGGIVRDSHARIQYVAVMNLELDGSRNMGGAGVSMIGGGSGVGGSDWLFEDLYIHNYGTNIVIDTASGEYGAIRDVTIRRCIISDAYPVSGHGQGIFAAGIGGQFLLEENVFDHNGYEGGTTPTVFNHNVYIYNYNGADWATQLTTFRGNIVARASSHGAQLRGGGVLYNNLAVGNSIGLLSGTGGGADGGVDPTNPLTTDMQYNVVTEGKDMEAPNFNALGWGIDLQWLAGGVVSNNLLANNLGSAPHSIWTGGQHGYDFIHDLTISNNVVYNWGQVEIEGNSSSNYNNIFANNTLVDTNPTRSIFYHYVYPVVGAINSSTNLFDVTNPNAFYYGGSHNFAQWRTAVGDTGSTMQQVAFTDPTRTVATYNSRVLGGPATIDAFMMRAKQQRRGNWDVRYTAAEVNNWIREGFGMVQLSPPPGGGNRPSGDTFVAPSSGANDAGAETVKQTEDSKVDSRVTPEKPSLLE